MTCRRVALLAGVLLPLGVACSSDADPRRSPPVSTGLDESFLDRGRPLGEARLLYEIGKAGADVRDLRARLALDWVSQCKRDRAIA